MCPLSFLMALRLSSLGAGVGTLLCKFLEPWGSEAGAATGRRVGQAQTPSGTGVYNLASRFQAELAETSARLFIF